MCDIWHFEECWYPKFLTVTYCQMSIICLPLGAAVEVMLSFCTIFYSLKLCKLSSVATKVSPRQLPVHFYLTIKVIVIL